MAGKLGFMTQQARWAPWYLRRIYQDRYPEGDRLGERKRVRTTAAMLNDLETLWLVVLTQPTSKWLKLSRMIKRR